MTECRLLAPDTKILKSYPNSDTLSFMSFFATLIIIFVQTGISFVNEKFKWVGFLAWIYCKHSIVSVNVTTNFDLFCWWTSLRKHFGSIWEYIWSSSKIMQPILQTYLDKHKKTANFVFDVIPLYITLFCNFNNRNTASQCFQRNRTRN